MIIFSYRTFPIEAQVYILYIHLLLGRYFYTTSKHTQRWQTIACKLVKLKLLN